MNNRDAAVAWCKEHLSRKGKLSGDDWTCCSPLRDEQHESFSVSVTGRSYHDFTTDERGTLTKLAGLMSVEPPAYDKTEHEEGNSPARTEVKKDTTGEAVRLWQSGKPAGEDHPYLVRKKVAPNGCREATIRGERVLLVPAFNEQGHVVGCERIKPDGSKMHLGQKSGAFFLLGAVEDGKPVVLAEGFSTGASVREGTGYPVVVCFGASNIPTLAKRLREQHPDMEIVAATDNDDAGRKAGEECPAGTMVIIPDGEEHTDWNDVFLLVGSDEARKIFDAKLEKARTVRPDVAEEKKPRYELVRIGDIELVEPEYLVGNLIEDKTLGMIFGASGSMKSFLALDLAACVAAGCTFHGRQVKEGPVIYLCGEGFGGIKRRLTAWEMNTGVSLKDAPLYISRRAPTLADRESARDVAESIRGIAETVGNPALIVVDTLARATVGADENSNSDMGQFIETIDEIRREHDCTLLTVHHSGLADKDRGRGASAIHAALDFEFQVVKDGMRVTMTNKKTKDSAEPEPMYFEATEVTVGQAQNGDAITSVALEETEASTRERTKPLTGGQQLGLNTFREAARKAETLDVHLEVWREFFYRAHTGDNPDTKRRAFDRARKDLVELGKLSVKDDVYSEAGEIAESIRNITAKRDTGQSGTFAGHVPLGTFNERDGQGHTPIRVSRCPACVPIENDAREEKEECPSVVLPDKESEKEEPVFLSRDSGSEPAKRSGSSDEDVSQLDPAKVTGAPDDSLPRGEGTPETPQQRAKGQDPDKGPGDSSSRGEDPVFLPKNGEVVFHDPLPLPFMWPGKGWIVEVEILGDGSRSFGLSDSKSGKARRWLREPKRGREAS